MHAFANAGIGPNSAGLGAGATSGGGGHLLPARGRGPRRRTRVTRRAHRRVRCPGVRSPRSGSSLPGVFFPRGAPVRAAPPARGAGAVNSAAPRAAAGDEDPSARDRDPGSGSRRIGRIRDPRDPAGAPPRAPTATHALFSSTAEEVTQIVGSSGGTHHAPGTGTTTTSTARSGPRTSTSRCRSSPARLTPTPRTRGAGRRARRRRRSGVPGSRAELRRAGPAGARIGAAEAPRPSGEQKLEQKLKRKRGKEAKEERRIASDCAKNADDAGSDSIMTGQPGPSEGAPEVSAREKDPRSSGSLGKTGGFGGSVVPKKSRSGRARGKKEDRPKKDQSAADILVSIANA